MISDSDLQLTVGMIATLAGQGDVSGSLDLLIFLAAQVNGDGAISQANIDTLADMSSSICGGGAVTTAHLTALADLVAEVIGYGVASGTMHCDCFMTSEITSAGELVTAQSCAQAVWSAVAAAFNDSGSMGNKLNTASAGGVDMEALAAVILAALEATTLPVNVKQINDVDLTGTGVTGDSWRPE